MVSSRRCSKFGYICAVVQRLSDTLDPFSGVLSYVSLSLVPPFLCDQFVRRSLRGDSFRIWGCLA